MEQHQQRDEVEWPSEYSDTERAALERYLDHVRDQQKRDLEALQKQRPWYDRNIQHGHRTETERYPYDRVESNRDTALRIINSTSEAPLIIEEDVQEAVLAPRHPIEKMSPRQTDDNSIPFNPTGEASEVGQECRALPPEVPNQPYNLILDVANAEESRASAAGVEAYSDSAPTESDTSPVSSIFDGSPESIPDQSTRPTTHDLSGLVARKRQHSVLPNASYADSIQSDGCVLGLDATAKGKLSSELASMIFAEMGVEVVPDDLTHSVAGLLYDCAAVLQRRVDRNDIGHQVAIFMRHRRNMIARELIAEQPIDRPPGPAMGLLDKIALLMSKEGFQGPPDDTDHSNIQDLTDEDEIEQPDIQEARSFLIGSAEFTWLLVRLKALCQLEMTGETYTSVRQTICRSLESGRRGYSFSLNWCPLAFMTSQYPAGTRLSQVICVNGNVTRAQATTCEQYVTQTWPDVGPAVLEHLDKYIESETSSLDTGSAQQNFELHIKRLPNDSTCIRVVADPNIVLEIGEVLAWLVVACRAGDLREAAAPTSVLSSPRVSSSLNGNFEISWTSDPLAQSSYLSEETCWHDLLNSCSIAQGYPIPRRTHNEPGLELSLGLMSMLGAVSRAVLFDSVLLLKGLCSMFVPLQKVGASVVWHYLVHRDEYGNFSDWMPHYEASHGREPLRSLDFSDLVDCPQYVGWSRETKMVAGSKDARYDGVDFGGRPIKPGFALDGVSISISKVLSVGTKAVAGKKDTPMFQCASGPYEQTINITAKWTALMYDTAERRGWLLDGATALLHMCRAAMTHPDAPEIGRGLPKSPVDSFTYAGANTDAKDILLDKQNRELIIYDDKEKPWTFEDLVLQHWGTFEEMKSHHFKLRAGETKQWEVSNPLSRRLEGFGFVDILTREPCMPRYHSLSGQASRWLQFTTQCGAINILGSRFGNLIAPLTSCKKTLEALPCGHDLIAAPVGLLHRIARRIGLVSASSIELCDGVYWNDPSRSFASDPCQCIESPQKDLMWLCGGGITSLEGRAGVNNCKRRRLVEMICDYSRGAIILGGRSSRFDDRLGVESSEAQVPVSPQSGKRRAVDEGYSSSRS
ncbi:hypothetical protein CB0940_05841 [Cercospora beticola]|uniref:Uncharacterized protein n=1 Tax=Cercospora beticola TaxID=122368 RepID=A0A2G5HZ45_CERBT|nr:hypothetical protein CB0940_05841 [Cercospora beticola]PIA97553.1 hypothetical protein CB0940_05841 [Cercospora beticola]WPA98433.1 hypothetical protein RHO25_003045 [Cercospora beticola]